MNATAPNITVRKLGIVARDYNIRFDNGYRDFSHILPETLKFLDDNGCDAVLFSLYSLVPRPGYDPRQAFHGLQNIQMPRKPSSCVPFSGFVASV